MGLISSLIQEGKRAGNKHDVGYSSLKRDVTFLLRDSCGEIVWRDGERREGEERGRKNEEVKIPPPLP